MLDWLWIQSQCLLGWFGQNGVALQSLATIVLVVVTVWYVCLTYSLQKSSRAQLAAVLQPNVTLSASVYRGAPAESQAKMFVEFSAANDGDYPVEVLTVGVRIGKSVCRIPEYDGITISPQHAISTSSRGAIEVDLPALPSYPGGQPIPEAELVVTCVDMMGQMRHEFTHYRKGPDSFKRHRRIR
jgi:hypothetical protein